MQRLLDYAVGLRATDALLLESQTNLFQTESMLDFLYMNLFSFDQEWPILVSFSFRSTTPINGPPYSTGGYRCKELPADEGIRPADVARFMTLRRHQLIAIGVNDAYSMSPYDTFPLEGYVAVVKELRSASDLPIMVSMNAGICAHDPGDYENRYTPDMFAAVVPDLVNAGATILGGGIGSTPAYIAAMKEAIDKLGVGWKLP
jgi:hypothetical protein